MLRREGNVEAAIAAAESVIETMAVVGASHQNVKIAFAEALDSNMALGRLERVEQLLGKIEALRPGEKPPFLRAQASRFRGRLAAIRREDDAVVSGFTDAERIFREFGLPFWLAVTELEHAERLAEEGDSEEGEHLLAEAREVFERLEAAPWVERVNGVLSVDQAAVQAQ